MSQQRKLKDDAIQALQAAVGAKEAEISRLKNDTAPNIATSTQIGRFLTSIVVAARRTILTETAELPGNPEPRGIIGGQI